MRDFAFQLCILLDFELCIRAPTLALLYINHGLFVPFFKMFDPIYFWVPYREKWIIQSDMDHCPQPDMLWWPWHCRSQILWVCHAPVLRVAEKGAAQNARGWGCQLLQNPRSRMCGVSLMVRLVLAGQLSIGPRLARCAASLRLCSRRFQEPAVRR